MIIEEDVMDWDKLFSMVVKELKEFKLDRGYTMEYQTMGRYAFDRAHDAGYCAEDCDAFACEIVDTFYN